MRIRSVKPELVQHPNFGSLSDGAARMYYGLLAVADDYGRCPASAGYLAGQIFYAKARPASLIAKLRNELEAAGWVRTYVAKGSDYLEIMGWSDVGGVTYQLIKKQRQSRFPAPTSAGEPPPETSPEPPPEPPDLDLDLERDQEREREREPRAKRNGAPSNGASSNTHALEALRAAETLQAHVRKNISSGGAYNLAKSIEEVEKLHDAGAVSYERINAAISWVLGSDDDFWRARILDGAALRRNWVTITAQMRALSKKQKQELQERPRMMPAWGDHTTEGEAT